MLMILGFSIGTTPDDVCGRSGVVVAKRLVGSGKDREATVLRARIGIVDDAAKLSFLSTGTHGAGLDQSCLSMPLDSSMSALENESVSRSSHAGERRWRFGEDGEGVEVGVVAFWHREEHRPETEVAAVVTDC